MSEKKIEVTVSEYQIEHAINKAVTEAIHDKLRYNTSKKALEEAVDKQFKQAIPKLDGLIEAQIQKSVLDVLTSDQFKDAAQAALMDAIKRKFSGAFDSVIIASARKCADDTVKRALLEKVISESAVRAINENT